MPLIVAGGHAISFMSALTLDMRKRSIQDSDPLTREEAVKIGVSVRKNHCVPDRNPYLKTEYFAVFGEGIEQVLTTLETAVEQGVLRKGGAWINWDNSDGTTKYKWNGKSEYRQFMRNHPEVLKELLGLVNGVEQMTVEEIDSAKADETAIKEMAVKNSKKQKKEEGKEIA